jgi:pyruvate formate lyase activating enzyme
MARHCRVMLFFVFKSSPYAEFEMNVEGYIHSVVTGGAVDGPGLRFVVFMAGCALRCQYCHNPDSWLMKDGEKTDTDALLKEISDYREFLVGRGGVTASGGEPLAQPDFIKALFQGCKAMGLHTALDTSGFLGDAADEELLRATDLVLLDIKHFDAAQYKNVTGGDLAPTLTFAERLAAMKKNMWLRYVLVPGLSDDLDSIEKLAAYARALGNVERVEVLPFHKMGEPKWEALGYGYKLKATEPPSAELTAKVRTIFWSHGLPTV